MPTQKEMEQPFDCGREAFEAGLTEDDNPFGQMVATEEVKRAFDAWNEGWFEAYDEEQAKDYYREHPEADYEDDDDARHGLG